MAFSTLGCPGTPLADVLALARTSGWTGLELRAADDEPVHVGLDTAQRGRIRAQLRRAAQDGVTALALASYVRIASERVDDDACVADALLHARLAADLGVPYLRVFPGATDIDDRPDQPGSRARADARAVRRLVRIAARLPDGVHILLETHDSHPRGADLARILAAAVRAAPDPVRIGAIWDVLHPWRCGESVAATARLLAPYLVHAQVKDVASPTERTPLPLGAGTVPLTAFYRELDRLGYEGWLSLEWEARWHPEAAPLAEALAASVRPTRPTRPTTPTRQIRPTGPAGPAGPR
ncbi:TIM barrel protein [Streptomyces sp. SID4948]|nr:sugar phosphate isomerase/epimerase [Streptomyces sp. SID4948]MYS21374.1 TIM barrel protein [Streptomyces sp. SID4948]